jgi:hypothetical protein
MTGEVKLEFPAMTLNEAVMTATTKWRTLVEDPEAELPWSTHIAFYEAPQTAMDNGRMIDAGTQTMALVQIEFDRKFVDEITGATTVNP